MSPNKVSKDVKDPSTPSIEDKKGKNLAAFGNRDISQLKPTIPQERDSRQPKSEINNKRKRSVRSILNSKSIDKEPSTPRSPAKIAKTHAAAIQPAQEKRTKSFAGLKSIDKLMKGSLKATNGSVKRLADGIRDNPMPDAAVKIAKDVSANQTAVTSGSDQVSGNQDRANPTVQPRSPSLVTIKDGEKAINPPVGGKDLELGLIENRANNKVEFRSSNDGKWRMGCCCLVLTLLLIIIVLAILLLSYMHRDSCDLKDLEPGRNTPIKDVELTDGGFSVAFAGYLHFTDDRNHQSRYLPLRLKRVRAKWPILFMDFDCGQIKAEYNDYSDSWNMKVSSLIRMWSSNDCAVIDFKVPGDKACKKHDAQRNINYVINRVFIHKLEVKNNGEPVFKRIPLDSTGDEGEN